MTITSITEDELRRISADTETRLTAFVESKWLNMRELASLSRRILKDMGRTGNLIQDLLMMQTLRQVREEVVSK